MVDISTFGTTPAGDEVHAYTLTAGEVSVRVMDFGATLLGAKVPDRAGDAADIVLGFGALDGYLNNPPATAARWVLPPIAPTRRGPARRHRVPAPQNDGPASPATCIPTSPTVHKRMWRAAVDEAAKPSPLRMSSGTASLAFPATAPSPRATS
ncbi:MAG: hypothetical protein ACLTKG_05540 [Collinsella intestinalis]